MTTRSSRSLLLLGLLTASPLAGCAAGADSDPAAGESIGESAEPVVSGVSGTAVAPITGLATDRNQSETAVAVGTSGAQTVVMTTYNDETNTGATIQYTPSTRTVFTGASLMGWSFSTDLGNTWTKKAQLAPPAGVAVLWGDPAATANKKNGSFVYISNLAVPTSKWPAGGSWSGGLDGAPPLIPPVLGGACIARSTDGGKTFAFSASQPCLMNANKDFYDGGSMASGADGSVYAAFVNDQFDSAGVNTIEVWRASTETANFVQLPNPFPGKVIATHPRIRVDASSRVVVLAQDSTGNLWITRQSSISPAAWLAPVWAGAGTITDPSIAFASVTVRTGPQFSFDINPTALSTDTFGLRIVYTYRDSSGVLHLDGSHCTPNLSNCFHAQNGTSGWQYPPPGWPTNTGDQFNPLVSFGVGSGGVASKWRMSFWSREEYVLGNDQIIPMAVDLQVSLSNNLSLGNITQLATPQTPCPDFRGYWGDYDTMTALAPDAAGKPRFLRPISDSTGAVCAQQQFTEDPLHLTSLRFN